MDEDVYEYQPPIQTSRSLSSSPSSSPLPSRSSSPARHSSSPARRSSSLARRSPPPPPSDPSDSEQNAPNVPIGEAFPIARVPKIRTAIQFIEGVESATLGSQFSSEELRELLEPEEHLSMPLEDPQLRLSLLNYIALLGSSRDTYEAVRQNIEQCTDVELLSYFQVEKRARELSGLITWEHHMCINSCVGFTGPYTTLT